MNIDIVYKNISFRNSPFYKNKILFTFIEAYFLNIHKLKFKDDPRFQLLKRYKFGSNFHPIDFDNYFDIFIGCRFISRKYYPFFLSISKYDHNEYEVNGFLTLMDNDLENSYFSTYTILNDFINNDFNLTIMDDKKIYPDKRIKKSCINKSILENLELISKKTGRKNELIKNKV